eukprot:3552617-Pyramimonas_sp.AAC.1
MVISPPFAPDHPPPVAGKLAGSAAVRVDVAYRPSMREPISSKIQVIKPIMARKHMIGRTCHVIKRVPA